MLAMHEQERLRLIRELDLLDEDPDPSFDALTAMAANICGTSLSLVTLVDVTRQFFVSECGLATHDLEMRETPLEVSFCAQAIRTSEVDGVFEVEDTHLDERFRENDLVTGHPRLRFYAGVPLRPMGDHAVGTLCVLDTTPSSLTDGQRRDLLQLASIAEQLMRLRLLAKAEGKLLERVEKSERYYRYLADHTEDVVLVNNAALAMTYYSPNMPAFFGYTKAEVDALPENHPFITVGGVPIEPGHRHSVSLDHPVQSFRATGWHKDGTPIELSLDVLAVYHDERVFEYRTTIRDIGGLVEFEDQLREANRQLISAERRRSHAVRNLAHDLSAPLAAIRITTESVRDQIPESQLRTQVDHLVEFASHAQALVGDLRLVNDPDATQPTMSLQPHNLAELVEHAAHQFLGGPTTDLVSLDLADVIALVDARAVTRIVTNLLTNVLAHNPSGTCATVRLSADEANAILRVEDDGAGIAVEDRRSMLEPYAGLNPNGSGLGLAIIDALVAAHGGTVEILENQPRGTVVEIRFPL